MTPLATDLRVLPSHAEAVEATVAEIVYRIRTTLERRPRARLALAGGGTPRALHQRLLAVPWRAEVDWSRVEIFWGDERCVPPDHVSSNYRMAAETLLNSLHIVPAATHRIRGELPPQEAAREYAALLGDAPLDLIILGMGGDGHTLSIFPDTPAPPPGTRVVVTRAPVEPRARVSLTLETVEQAGSALLLVTGAAKAGMVTRVLGERSRGVATLPAARVTPKVGAPIWILDPAAAIALEANVGSE
jgi:6-phosphogluconolactonase